MYAAAFRGVQSSSFPGASRRVNPGCATAARTSRHCPIAIVNADESDDLISGLVGSFVRGDLFDQIHNAAPKLGVGDARECAGQRQSL
jgi:hypothetical protein